MIAGCLAKAYDSDWWAGKDWRVSRKVWSKVHIGQTDDQRLSGDHTNSGRQTSSGRVGGTRYGTVSEGRRHLSGTARQAFRRSSVSECPSDYMHLDTAVELKGGG